MFPLCMREMSGDNGSTHLVSISVKLRREEDILGSYLTSKQLGEYIYTYIYMCVCVCVHIYKASVFLCTIT